MFATWFPIEAIDSAFSFLVWLRVSRIKEHFEHILYIGLNSIHTFIIFITYNILFLLVVCNSCLLYNNYDKEWKAVCPIPQCSFIY
jgi:hypothetical protein